MTEWIECPKCASRTAASGESADGTRRCAKCGHTLGVSVAFPPFSPGAPAGDTARPPPSTAGVATVAYRGGASETPAERWTHATAPPAPRAAGTDPASAPTEWAPPPAWPPAAGPGAGRRTARGAAPWLVAAIALLLFSLGALYLPLIGYQYRIFVGTGGSRAAPWVGGALGLLAAVLLGFGLRKRTGLAAAAACAAIGLVVAGWTATPARAPQAPAPEDLSKQVVLPQGDETPRPEPVSPPTDAAKALSQPAPSLDPVTLTKVLQVESGDFGRAFDVEYRVNRPQALKPKATVYLVIENGGASETQHPASKFEGRGTLRGTSSRPRSWGPWPPFGPRREPRVDPARPVRIWLEIGPDSVYEAGRTRISNVLEWPERESPGA